MNFKKILFFKLLTLSCVSSLYSHPGYDEHSHEPKEVILSEQDVKFVLENQNVSLAYIPGIISELFILLKDLAEPMEIAGDLKMFIDLIEQKSHMTYKSTAIKAIFGALSLLKNHESMLPKSYVDRMCDILYGYQKSLHKEENILQCL
jgi:hypothetical protein